MQQSNGAQRRDRPAAVNRGLCSSFTDEWFVTYNTRPSVPSLPFAFISVPIRPRWQCDIKGALRT